MPQKKMQKRIAVIDRELCKPSTCNYLCQRICPVNRSGRECITVSEEDRKPFIDESLCIGCGICVKKCPMNAIAVVNLPEELKEDPIHRYGKNLFALYRLPVPKQNSVVGLIGLNGIGKSTVLNILSGSLKPNAGELKKEASWDAIAERFRGTELQGYLERLAAGKIRVAYKPQNVDLVPKRWKGKAGELLKRADEREKLDGIVKIFGVKGMLEKDVSQLSGGELQILAVIATMLKNAELYFFDEPSSYLDVEQRLRVAKEIRRLSETAFVMVVEHDLAVADYLADHTHILYGEPGVFGAVSRPYGVRIGINTYLEGFIREENMRFRDEQIIFEKRARQSGKTVFFMEFPAFEKRLGTFSLKTGAGNLYRGEVVGILGPNGIGKTTFIRMLAGEIKPDKTASDFIDAGMRISYKPQRLVLPDEDAVKTVQDYLESKGDITDKESKRILMTLGLGRLLERSIRTLSGGELQAVFIAAALIQEADLMLFDEPSAFLDVEQRLRVAKLLRMQAEGREVPLFVVDHDLQFIDSISDRVIVFSGRPGAEGYAGAPRSLGDGMNSFLKTMGVTFRRDPHTGRPRANKPGSQKDSEQKQKGRYYYME